MVLTGDSKLWGMVFTSDLTIIELAEVIRQKQLEQVGIEDMTAMLQALNELSDDAAQKLLAGEGIKIQAV